MLRKVNRLAFSALPGGNNAVPAGRDDQIRLGNRRRQKIRIGEKELQFAEIVARRFIQQMVRQRLPLGISVVKDLNWKIEVRERIFAGPEKFRPGCDGNFVAAL